jgi:hypothetical protein
MLFNRLALTCLVISTKFIDEHSFPNIHYAIIGGISTKELAFLERELLKMVDYDLLVKPKEYKKHHFDIKTQYAQLKKLIKLHQHMSHKIIPTQVIPLSRHASQQTVSSHSVGLLEPI